MARAIFYRDQTSGAYSAMRTCDYMHQMGRTAKDVHCFIQFLMKKEIILFGNCILGNTFLLGYEYNYTRNWSREEDTDNTKCTTKEK